MKVSSYANPGSIGGASGDSGVEYRRGVASYAVAFGLAGVPLPGLSMPGTDSRVLSVSLETDNAVDDIRIDFDSGCRALVQAKRSLRRGKSLNDAVAQWVHAARAGLDPAKDRLVIVASTLSGPMADLQRVLDRGRTDDPGAPTRGEAEVLQTIRKILCDLSEAERDLVLKCAVIWKLEVEEPDEVGSQLAISELRHVVADGRYDTARTAWEKLMRISGRAARLRGGHKLSGWYGALHGEGIVITSKGRDPAAVFEVRRQALERYTKRLIREGSELDLRAIGAELPNLSLEHADADLQVVVSEDDRNARKLIWAFLRRGRVVLTGLPGGGKSTALKQLAAQLCDDPSFPLPVRVSLRDIDQLDSSSNFRDRLVAAAVRDERQIDRDVLAAEINDRLDGTGDIALLLDSLDETYDRRHSVVAEISALVANLPSDVNILLATRDVAYGQAATLGWSSVRLCPPSNAMRTVLAVLEVAAPKNEIETKTNSWIAEREAWVRSALAQDRLLAETPLIPILLALLAVLRALEQLPRRRARILEAIVQDFVVGRELLRVGGRTLGRLEGGERVTASMQAFTSAAAEIQTSNGKASAKSVVEAIAADLREPWSLTPAQASIVGQDAVRLLDESGIFVISGADETIAPRIALFAEIGDAMRIVALPEEIPGWVEARIKSQQFEPLVLACTLNASVVNATADALRDNPGDAMLAKSLVQARQEGAELGEATVRQVCESLIAHIADGTRDGWNSWRVLLQLPIPDELRDSAETAANQHSPQHVSVARASLALQLGPLPLDDEHLQLLKEVLAVRWLPHRPPSGNDDTIDISSWSIDPILERTQIAAAEMLLNRRPDTAPLVSACAIDAPQGLQDSLIDLLSNMGFSDDVQTIHDANRERDKDFKRPSWLADYDDTCYTRFLQVVANHSTTELSASQRTNLNELADFVTTLQLHDGGAVHLYKQTDEVLAPLVALTATLYKFDRGVLASQAAVAIDRVNRWGMDSYYALFDNAHERSVADWCAVNDPELAAQMLMNLFSLGIGQATFAAKSLWKAPISDRSVQHLRDLVPNLAVSPSHERIGALALASLLPLDECERWMGTTDPVLRAAAAEIVNPMNGDFLSDQFRKLLDDPDGHVQEAALNGVVRSEPPNLLAILDEIASRALPGWMCLSCRTVNPPPGPNSCSAERCHRGGPNPANLATSFQRMAQIAER